MHVRKWKMEVPPWRSRRSTRVQFLPKNTRQPHTPICMHDEPALYVVVFAFALNLFLAPLWPVCHFNTRPFPSNRPCGSSAPPQKTGGWRFRVTSHLEHATQDARSKKQPVPEPHEYVYTRVVTRARGCGGAFGASRDACYEDSVHEKNDDVAAATATPPP